MKFQKIITFLALVITLASSCEFQTFSTPKFDEAKLEYANYYLNLLEAEEIEVHPTDIDYDWADDDLPLLIKNSQLVRIMENNELTNVAVVDTLASFLWDAVDNKEKYKTIRIGFLQSSKSGIFERIKSQWIEYPTDIFE